MRPLISISWSGGKDSALALYKLLERGEYEVHHLHTVFNAETKRVGLHGIHESLIEAQAESLNIPLRKIYLPASEHHNAYERLMIDYYKKLSKEKISRVMFGDIFLEDLKHFRDMMLSAQGLKGIYPLWQKDSVTLIDEFLSAGFETRICAANAILFQEKIIGKKLDSDLIQTFPDSVDVCGENGEFHSFVVNGPIFKRKMNILNAQIVDEKYEFSSIDDAGNKVSQSSKFTFQEMMLA